VLFHILQKTEWRDLVSSLPLCVDSGLMFPTNLVLEKSTPLLHRLEDRKQLGRVLCEDPGNCIGKRIAVEQNIQNHIGVDEHSQACFSR